MFSKSRSTPCSLVIVETSCCFHMWQMAEKNASPGTFWWVQVKLSLNGCKWPPTMMKLGDGLNHLVVWQLTWTRPKGWYSSGAQDIIIYLEVHNHQLDQFLLESRLSKRETVGAEFFQKWIHIQRIGQERLGQKVQVEQGKTEEFIGHKWLFHRK